MRFGMAVRDNRPSAVLDVKERYRCGGDAVSTVARTRSSEFVLPGPAGKIRAHASYKGDMTPLRPDLMTPAGRLDEVAEILAVGLLRLKAKKSSALSATSGEGSLDCVAEARRRCRRR
jgi:hypothetical protein